MKELLKRALTAFVHIFTANLLFKLLSFVLAILLWSYVITTENPIRTKPVEDVAIEYRGLSQLKERGLVIKNDYSDIITADVSMDIPQNEYRSLSAYNIACTVDFSRIFTEGTHRVYLSATYGYTDAASISPAFVDIEVEELRSRTVPVRVTLTGETPEGYWRSQARPSRDMLVIEGAKSDVEIVDYAEVILDIEGAEGSLSRTLPFTLYTADGAEVTSASFTPDQSNCVATVDIYPIKSVQIMPSIPFYSGVIADGYELGGISIFPSETRIAAPADVLGGINAITIAQIDLNGVSDNLDQACRLQMPSGITWSEYTEANAMVAISEKHDTITFSRVSVHVENEEEDARVTLEESTVSVTVSGPRSKIEALLREDIVPYVNLAGYESGGVYSVPVRTRLAERDYELTVTVSPAVINVTIE